MVFVANLLGLFEFNFNNFLANILNHKISKEEKKKKNIFIPNFFSGILAVLLATPCSAPFVGVAISFALSAEMKEIFLIFGSMSLGLSLPYLILIVFPKSVKLMPKPGAWMVRIKHLMAGFLAATAVWLVYILIDNIGFIAAMSAAILAILILLFFKVISKINLSKSKLLVAVIVLITLISAIFVVPNRLAYLDKMIEKEQQANWIKFDESKISDLVKQGKTVVIDITADWCISCKANKLLVLNSEEVKAKLADNNIVAMRGDLTKPDEAIFNFMKKYNRYGIPFNIVFGPNSPDGVLTSELLSKKSFLEAIDKASYNQNR
jgi:suppressor for copper-sensitivity B